MRDFNHSVNVLVKAYFEGTLEHSNCTACAVGNLIADANGFPRIYSRKSWTGMTRYFGINEDWFAGTNGSCTHVRCTPEVVKTGYTAKELGRIEVAFEGRSLPYIKNTEDERQFISLMRVVDVLADIHGVELKQTEEAKKLFVK